MKRWLWRLSLSIVKWLLIIIGFTFFIWGIIGTIIWPLPGGPGIALIGLAILAIFFVWAKKFKDGIRSWLKEKFPRFYDTMLARAENIEKRWANKLRRLLEEKEE